MHVDEALERIRVLQTGEHALLADAWANVNVGRLRAMKGDFESANEVWTDSRQVYVDAGLQLSAGSFALGGSEIAFRAGDLRVEQERLREGLEVLDGIGERSFYSTVALALADSLYRAGAADPEIEELCARARESTSPDDVANFVWLDMVEGLLHARRGNYDEAVERSRRAVARAETTDFHLARSRSRACLAEVVALSGRGEEAAEVAADAFRIFDAKGDIAGAAQFRLRLSSLGVAVD